MKTTIDGAGRIVIPKEIRQQAGLGPGMPVEIRYENGQVEIEPATLPGKLVRKGRLLVAVPEVDVPPLTCEIVQETLDSLREER